MHVTRFLIIAFCAVALGLVWFEMISIYSESSDLAAKNDDMLAQIKMIEDENVILGEDIEYYSQPQNAEKILRAKFNYKKPGEEMIIIVPDN